MGYNQAPTNRKMNALNLDCFPNEPTLADFNEIPLNAFCQKMRRMISGNFVAQRNIEPICRHPHNGLGRCNLRDRTPSLATTSITDVEFYGRKSNKGRHGKLKSCSGYDGRVVVIEVETGDTISVARHCFRPLSKIGQSKPTTHRSRLGGKGLSDSRKDSNSLLQIHPPGSTSVIIS